VGLATLDPQIACDVVPQSRRYHDLAHIMSNSFGFGGNNCVLVLSQ
jgi:3-oxoacyl-(acyl-carrier-protein) synthase